MTSHVNCNPIPFSLEILWATDHEDAKEVLFPPAQQGGGVGKPPGRAVVHSNLCLLNREASCCIPQALTSGKFFTRWSTSGFPPVCLETLLSCLGSAEIFTPLLIYMTSLVDVEDLLTKYTILLLAIWQGSLKYVGHTGLFWATGFWWPFEIWIGKGINVSVVNCLANKNAVCDILLSSREILAD